MLLFLLVPGGYALGALAPLVLGLAARAGGSGMRYESAARRAGFGAALISSLAGCALSLQLLLSRTSLSFELHLMPAFGAMAVRVDGLSAFFLGVISLLGAAVSVYSFRYAEEYAGKGRTGVLVGLYNLFLLSMSGVVVAGHAVLFLLFWELMSITTFFLINLEHRDPASRRAAFIYAAMTHGGAAFLIAMFGLLYRASGSFGFESFRAAGPLLSGPVRAAVFLCATAGFGMKAGIVPFHIWLPEAHPAAPTNVSALMSGVMIKMGVYGMVRVFFDILGADVPEWCGVLILLIAVSSAVLGVLYALMEHDLKRLLAYHSLENIGIILIGVGAALLFSSFGYEGLASLALVAGLFHVLNHATFKGLLFLGAGSVVRAARSRNLEELGGLAKKLPWTSFLFLVGAVAISALPPLNGFASEWLTFQSLLMGFAIPSIIVKIAVPLTVALLALTGALAAACFVKAYGIAFLGMPRSGRAEAARESPASMIAPMVLLAAACIVLGCIPGLVVGALKPLSAGLVHAALSGEGTAAGGGVSLSLPTGAGIAPGLLVIAIVALLALPLGLARLVGGRVRVRRGATWACGLERLEPRMQYTATGFSKPLRLIFSNIYRARHEIEVSEDSSPYFHPQIRLELRMESVFLQHFYGPVYRFIVRAAGRFRKIQTGRIQTYLAYIFATLVLLLLFAR